MADVLAEARVEAVAVALVVLQTPLGDLAEEEIPGVQALADRVLRIARDDAPWLMRDTRVRALEDAWIALESIPSAIPARSRVGERVGDALSWASGVFRSDAVDGDAVGDTLGVRRARWAVEDIRSAARRARVSSDVWDATWRDALARARAALR